MSRKIWWKSVPHLVKNGLINYQVTTNGYRAEVRYGRQFTHLPEFPDLRWEMATPRAVKAWLAVCRCLGNKSGSWKLRLKTIAAWMGRSVRTAMLALAECRMRGMLVSYRTGRASWFTAPKPPDASQLNLFDPPIAHHCGILLRILSFTTTQTLSRVLAHFTQRRRADAQRLRMATIFERTMTKEQLGLRESLKRLKIDHDEANVLIMEHTADEILYALELMGGRNVRNPAKYLETCIRRGWCHR